MDCDYGRNPIKTQKHDTFVRNAIMIAAYRSSNKEDCDHDRSPIKTQKYDIFVRTAIMIAILIKTHIYDIFFVRIVIMIPMIYVSTFYIFEAICFFRSDYCGAFTSFAAEKRFCA